MGWKEGRTEIQVKNDILEDMHEKFVNLRWEAEMKASILGAAMVTHTSRVPTPNPASSLAVIFSISCLVASAALRTASLPLHFRSMEGKQNFLTV